MKFRETPDFRFENLPDYDFAPNYVAVDDDEGGMLNMHYIEAGPKDGPPVVLIHGNPTWCFMWRKIVPRLAEAGFRAIAIDMIGMGRSQKPTRMKDYTIARHEKWIREALFDKLKLDGVHFVLHDWGGIIGLRTVAAHQDRTASVTFSNTGLPVRDPNEPITQMAMPGPRPAFWSGPDEIAHLAKKSDDPAQVLNLINARMGGLMLEASQWLTVTHFSSPEAIKAAYTAMLDSKMTAEQGIIFDLSGARANLAAKI